MWQLRHPPPAVALTGGGLVFLWRLVRNRPRPTIPVNSSKHVEQALALAPSEYTEAEDELRELERSGDVGDGDVNRGLGGSKPGSVAGAATDEKGVPPRWGLGGGWAGGRRRGRWALAAAAAAVAAGAAAAAVASSPTPTEASARDEKKNTKQKKKSGRASSSSSRTDERVRIDIRRARGGIVAFDASRTVPRTAAGDDTATKTATAWSAVRRASLGQLRPRVDLRDVLWQKVHHPHANADDERGTDNVVIEQEARWRWGWVRGSSRMTVLVTVNDADKQARFKLFKPAAATATAAPASSVRLSVQVEFS
jgi:hypothetical protein